MGRGISGRNMKLQLKNITLLPCCRTIIKNEGALVVLFESNLEPDKVLGRSVLHCRFSNYHENLNMTAILKI
jgi:hypothetical protein